MRKYFLITILSITTCVCILSHIHLQYSFPIDRMNINGQKYGRWIEYIPFVPFSYEDCHGYILDIWYKNDLRVKATAYYNAEGRPILFKCYYKHGKPHRFLLPSYYEYYRSGRIKFLRWDWYGIEIKSYYFRDKGLLVKMFEKYYKNK